MEIQRKRILIHAESRVEAKTIQEAIVLALKKLGVERKKVEVRVLNEGDKGLFGIEGPERAKVKVIIIKEINRP